MSSWTPSSRAVLLARMIMEAGRNDAAASPTVASPCAALSKSPSARADRGVSGWPLGQLGAREQEDRRRAERSAVIECDLPRRTLQQIRGWTGSNGA